MLLQEKQWHLALLHHSWRHLVVLNWLLTPDKNTKKLQYTWVLTEISKCQFHVKVYHFGFSSSMWSTSAAASIQITEPIPWYFTAAELQFVCLSNDYHQLYHLFLLCHPLLLHHHHFSPNHTLLPHSNLAFTLTTPTHYITTISTCEISLPSVPVQYHHHHVYTSLHCHCYYSLNFIFHFWILHFTFTFYTRFVLSCLKTHNNNVKSSSTFIYFSQIMHIIFQVLVKEMVVPFCSWSGCLEVI